MTKEELEKEAEEGYIKRIRQVGVMGNYRNQTYNDGYLDGAEPREKRIEELEQKLETERSSRIALVNEIAELPDKWCRNKDDYCPHLAKLEKENAELKEENKVLTQNLEDTEIVNKALEKENAELREKLEIEQIARSDWFGKAVTKDEQLTKAKEYIKLLLMNCVGVYENTRKTIAEIQAEAEQFLKECK